MGNIECLTLCNYKLAESINLYLKRININRECVPLNFQCYWCTVLPHNSQPMVRNGAICLIKTAQNRTLYFERFHITWGICGIGWAFRTIILNLTHRIFFSLLSIKNFSHFLRSCEFVPTGNDYLIAGNSRFCIVRFQIHRYLEYILILYTRNFMKIEWVVLILEAFILFYFFSNLRYLSRTHAKVEFFWGLNSSFQVKTNIPTKFR